MFGSSSTTRSRASGVVPRAGRAGRGLPDTSPPKGAGAVVMPKGFARGLQARWTLPVSRLARHDVGRLCRRRLSCPGELLAAMLPRPSAAHRPAASPVTDRVVLGAAESPPSAEVGAHGAHRGG